MDEIKDFTKEEKQMLVDALLFYGCADVMNNCSDKKRGKFIDLAIKIHENPSKDMCIDVSNPEDEKITQKIVDNFKIKKYVYKRP